MDWILKLIEKHTQDGVLNQDALMKDINKEFPSHAVPKSQYNTLAEAKAKLEGDMADRDAQLEDLKKIDATGLQAEITRLQGENTAAKEKYENELKDLQLTNAIKLALSGKVHDEDLASQLIKKDELILSEDGKVVGLEDQITTLKEKKAFLFKEETTEPSNPGPQPGFQIGNPKPNNPKPNNPAGVDDDIAAAFGNTVSK